MSEAFETWVNSPECFEDLKGCASQVSNRAARLGIVLEDSSLESENTNDYLTAVASDLWRFLKGNAVKLARQATALILSGDDDAFMSFVCRQFLDDLIEQRRTTSPFHDYYRRMRALLSDTVGIRYETQARRGAFYAYSTRLELAILPDHLCSHDYDRWRACDVPFRNIRKHPAMVRLSRHFWDQSLDEFLAEYLLPVRELVRFAFAKYPLMLTVEYGDALGEGDGDENAVSLENRLVDCNSAVAFDDAWKRQLPVIEADIIDTQLETLAWDCVAEMTEQERIILARIDAGEKLEAIAALLDMKSLSNVSYHQKKAYSRIHTKWSLWGPPSAKQFTDVDEEEFFMFYEKVIGFCKSGEACRDGKKGVQA
ncbi:MAG: hypothetical protein HGA26_08125 [Chlorobiaceae bacterium]|nr:hypothetical protein [Chlorobiaceae bacterium]